MFFVVFLWLSEVVFAALAFGWLSELVVAARNSDPAGGRVGSLMLVPFWGVSRAVGGGVLGSCFWLLSHRKTQTQLCFVCCHSFAVARASAKLGLLGLNCAGEERKVKPQLRWDSSSYFRSPRLTFGRKSTSRAQSDPPRGASGILLNFSLEKYQPALISMTGRGVGD